MGEQERARAKRVEGWLAAGGTVLAATERAARSVRAAFHAAKRDEGCRAWPTPAIFSWESWVRERWLERNRAGLVLLNPLQEQAIWSRVIGESRIGEGLLHPGALAASAQQAYRLLAAYAPSALRAKARLGWGGDAAVFSEWLGDFEERLLSEGLASASRIGLQLSEALCEELEPAESGSDETHRRPLLLIGFDRVLETQRVLLDAWGRWQLDELASLQPVTRFLAAQDADTELEACVAWLRERSMADPKARLLVVTTELQGRRGELERALLGASNDVESGLVGSGLVDTGLDFEFSLGVPFGRVGVARAAMLILRWLTGPLSEPEVDWLVSSGHCAANPGEELALAGAMRELRRRGQERPEWELSEFPGSGGLESDYTAQWAARMSQAAEMLAQSARLQTPLEWAALARRLLLAAGWPGFRPAGSTAFQAQQRWDKVLESCGSLGYDGSQMDWAEFVSTVGQAVSATIFATESKDAAIQITEPLESAGQLADGIWFLGVQEENWPGRGQPHPLLPIALQRDAGMPHSSSLADWKLAQEATTRLLASADEVVFSYSRHSEDAEARPSRLAMQSLGDAVELPADGMPAAGRKRRRPLTEVYEDRSRIRFPHSKIGGGAAALTKQSLCPFQAFATARLGAEVWEPAEVGLNARQRGQLLHAVLHLIWGGEKTGGISRYEQLLKIDDLTEYVWRMVSRAMAESFDEGQAGLRRRGSLPDRFPKRLLELEAERLTGLITEWLEYERARVPFTVEGTEVRSDVTIAGLSLRLRLDRIDRLEDGSLLVVDYKGGDVGPGAWLGDRPEDVQLPLYATFAVAAEDAPLEGLVFARVKAGEVGFHGRVRNALLSVNAGLSSRNDLVKNPLTADQIEEWRETIERLGRAFLEGDAEVDPKDGFKTCDQCHLHAVCRVYENRLLAEEEGDLKAEDPGNGGGGGGGDA